MVKQAVENLPVGKAPSPDGFPKELYRVHWARVEPFIMVGFRDFQLWGSLLPSWGTSYLCFIPKMEALVMVWDFHPLSLSIICTRLLLRVLAS